jgi:acetyl esterase/lipase
MAMWPEEYEPLRGEALAVGRASMEYYADQLSSDDPADRLVAGRAMLAAVEREASGGRDEVIAGVPCRVFDPAGDDRRGTYLDIHGGAMTMGSARMGDASNDNLSKTLAVRVVSVDYRLAPEHPYPAGPDDCFAVARWVIDHEAGPIAIGGGSAGAYLAVLVLLRLRNEHDAADRFTGANLLYGVYDLSRTPSSRGVGPSELHHDGASDSSGMREAYVPGRSVEELRVPSISPLYADLRGMPPALFTVGHADHLLDDSLFMAARWQAYGNETELAVYPDCVHGFTGLPIEMATKANERVDCFLATAFGMEV